MSTSAPLSPALLSLAGLSVSLGGAPVVRGLSLDVAAGEFVGLIGPNGAGKSTLLRAIAGLLPAGGTASFRGRALAALSASQRAREIAYVPQEHEIAWPVPVETLVGLGRTPHRSGFAGFSARDRQAVLSAMERMDVARFADRPATALSGGEKARVLIARALAQETPLFLADEPAAGLDPAHQIALMRLFRDLAGEGRGVIASMHDLGLAGRWCTRLVLLSAGRIVADGLPAAVLTPENLRSIYGVTGFFAEAEGRLVVQPLDLAGRR
ncbi:ABC transporter ATP-binding protein [Rhizobiaceae bacterium BDR2-2]|uniref:ABC transporter ATP-binding protein n=1 Tax=Ectorhizobium quercum TaxID=2965071 RepID=A0AAE3N2E4_9HYPH|nr:ABC transporter ATP-binding protein [Ectorhizobium quercum]MCX8999553.1 ABC transporter ATP-binding protein [Ectorhizobium quercum]